MIGAACCFRPVPILPAESSDSGIPADNCLWSDETAGSATALTGTLTVTDGKAIAAISDAATKANTAMRDDLTRSFQSRFLIWTSEYTSSIGKINRISSPFLTLSEVTGSLIA